jgi:NAD(P)-dependent dehydrogenase (short-subunit alcohol dehydrogenase family)
LLVNNAGTGGPAGLEWEVDPDAWWECIESIVRGAFNCTQAVLPGMLTRGEGRVIDVASVTGTTAWPLVTATSLAKTALIRRVETLAAACGERGVKAFALHPGVVRTELLLSYRSHPDMAAFLDSAPDAVFSGPEVAARVVARIAGGELDGLSGRFVDATTDLDALSARDLSAEALMLRLVQP